MYHDWGAPAGQLPGKPWLVDARKGRFLPDGGLAPCGIIMKVSPELNAAPEVLPTQPRRNTMPPCTRYWGRYLASCVPL
jgi:hypothetical protein